MQGRYKKGITLYIYHSAHLLLLEKGSCFTYSKHKTKLKNKRKTNIESEPEATEGKN